MREHTVLFVDDEVNILQGAAAPAAHRGHERAVREPRARRRSTCSRSTPAQVVVTDQRMPEMSRRRLPRARARAPARHRAHDAHRLHRDERRGRRDQPRRDLPADHEAVERRRAAATLRQAFDHSDLKAEIKRLNQVTREQNFKLQDMNRNLEGKVRDRTKQLAEKHQQLRTAYVQTIRALAEAVDAKDAYTRGHSERVGVYASKIAREMGFPKDVIERVYIAGLLHDVGKIGVRDARDHEARPAHARGVRGDQARTRRSAARSSSRSTFLARRGAVRAPPPRVVRRLRPRLPGPPARRPDPAAVAHHPGRRHASRR